MSDKIERQAYIPLNQRIAQINTHIEGYEIVTPGMFQYPPSYTVYRYSIEAIHSEKQYIVRKATCEHVLFGLKCQPIVKARELVPQVPNSISHKVIINQSKVIIFSFS